MSSPSGPESGARAMLAIELKEQPHMALPDCATHASHMGHMSSRTEGP